MKFFVNKTKKIMGLFPDNAKVTSEKFLNYFNFTLQDDIKIITREQSYEVIVNPEYSTFYDVWWMCSEGIQSPA